MKNYKIKVNDEAESKEAQELFFELGYIWNIGSGVKHLDVKFLYARNGIITVGLCSGNFENSENKEITLPKLRDLVAQSKKEQGLISGADALRALADGKEIQWVSNDFKNWNDLDIWNANLKTFLNEKYIAEGEFKFRLKPSTITLNLEIPAPFEPNVGEVFYTLAPTAIGGYSEMHITDQKRMDDYAKLGAWRTEEEIKQVVAALRGGIKA